MIGKGSLVLALLLGIALFAGCGSAEKRVDVRKLEQKIAGDVHLKLIPQGDFRVTAICVHSTSDGLHFECVATARKKGDAAGDITLPYSVTCDTEDGGACIWRLKNGGSALGPSPSSLQPEKTPPTNTMADPRTLDRQSVRTANALLRKWGGVVDRKIKAAGCPTATPSPRCLATAIDEITSRLITEMPRLRAAGRDYLAEQILVWAKDEARRLPAVSTQWAYLRMYAGAVSLLDRLDDGFRLKRVARPDNAKLIGDGPGVVAIKEHLTASRYSFEETEASGSPTPEVALNVSGSETFQVAVYVYSSTSAATTASAAFAPIEKSNSNQIAVQAIGPDVYVGTTEAPAPLPRAKFEKIVVAAEGL